MENRDAKQQMAKQEATTNPGLEGQTEEAGLPELRRWATWQNLEAWQPPLQEGSQQGQEMCGRNESYRQGELASDSEIDLLSHPHSSPPSTQAGSVREFARKPLLNSQPSSIVIENTATHKR